jgi:hypothetical protein
MLGLPTHDPWKDWTFEISGGASAMGQEFIRNINLNTTLYISKVTPEIKIESANSVGYNKDTFIMEMDNGNDTSLNYVSYHIISRTMIVKSLGKHFGIGLILGGVKNQYSNLKFRLSTGIAAEYNLFSYDQATDRQLRFMYGIYYERSRFIQPTQEGKISAALARQDLKVKYLQIKSWGSVDAGLYATCYLNDLKKFAVSADITASINLTKGLYFTITAGASYVQNQISLPGASANAGEILTGNTQIGTNYGYHLAIGLSYRFGSKFNNHVNPRFTDF